MRKWINLLIVTLFFFLLMFKLKLKMNCKNVLISQKEGGKLVCKQNKKYAKIITKYFK